MIYIILWLWMNNKRSVTLKMGNTAVLIKQGDIFSEEGYKVIAFNEYFDTELGDIVSEETLNGKFIKEYVKNTEELDKKIEEDEHLVNRKTNINTNRTSGKKQKYKLGSIYKNSDDFLLTTFTKFNNDNNAFVTTLDYMEFMLNFWHELDKLYNGKKVAITIFGSGITRFQDGYNPLKQELLELILWSFRMSRLKLSSQLSIVIPSPVCKEINFYKLKEFEYGV
jgi:hypothetical protein